MRTSRWFIGAALAALTSVGCSDGPTSIKISIVNDNTGRSGTTVITGRDSSATCVNTYSFRVAPPNVNLLGMTIEEIREVFVRRDSLGTNCPQPYTFRFRSSDPVRIEVNNLTDNSAYVRAKNAGQNLTVCADAVENAAFILCAPASVGSAQSSTITIVNPTLSGTSGTSCQLFVQFSATTNPAGQTVTWSKLTNHIAGGAIDANGRFSYNAGAAGTDTVQARLASGATATGVVTVTSANCTSGTVTIVSPSLAGTSGNGCSLFVQFSATTNPSGLAVTWTKLSSNIAGGAIDNTGRFSYSAGAAGTDTVRVSLASGATAIGVVTVASTNCSTQSCTVTSFSPTAPDLSLYVGQQVQIDPRLTSSPAGCATSSYTASGAVTVSNTGLVTGGPGTGVGTVTVSVTGANVNPITLSFNVSGNSVVASPSSITLNNCTGFQATWNLSVAVNGSAGTATWSSTNPSVATVSSAGVATITGTAGTGSIIASTSVGADTIPVTVNTCPPGPRVDSVVVTPPTFADTVGMQRVFTATVYAVGGAATTVNWTISNPACGASSANGNTYTVAWSQACANVTVTATSTADNTKSDNSVGSVVSGNIVCTITWNNTTTGNITIPVGQTATLTGSCTNQFGSQFIPYWYVGAPPDGASPVIASVQGATTTITINGQQWPAGPQATIRGNNPGQVTVYMQAAVTDTTVRASRPVIVQ